MKDYATDKGDLFRERRHASGWQLLMGLVTGLLLAGAGWAGYDVYHALSPYVDSAAMRRPGAAVVPIRGRPRPDKARKYIRIQLPLPQRHPLRPTKAVSGTTRHEARASDAPMLGPGDCFALGGDRAESGEARSVGWRPTVG